MEIWSCCCQVARFGVQMSDDARPVEGAKMWLMEVRNVKRKPLQYQSEGKIEGKSNSSPVENERRQMDQGGGR